MASKKKWTPERRARFESTIKKRNSRIHSKSLGEKALKPIYVKSEGIPDGIQKRHETQNAQRSRKTIFTFVVLFKDGGHSITFGPIDHIVRTFNKLDKNQVKAFFMT